MPGVHLQLSVLNDRWIDEIERTQEANITALASATGGRKRPLFPGAKPPDSIEQEAKPPVQWKVVLKNGFNVS